MNHRRRSVFTFSFFMFVSLVFVIHSRKKVIQQTVNFLQTVDEDYDDIDSDPEFSPEDVTPAKFEDAVPIKEPSHLEDELPVKSDDDFKNPLEETNEEEKPDVEPEQTNGIKEEEIIEKPDNNEHVEPEKDEEKDDTEPEQSNKVDEEEKIIEKSDNVDGQVNDNVGEAIKEETPKQFDNKVEKTLEIKPLKKILLVANFRTGSSFVGDLIQNIPGVFYSFEPLYFLENTTESKTELIKSIFQCQFSQEYLDFINGYTGPKVNFMSRNRRGMISCFRNNATCAQPYVVSNLCSASRINLIKVVRLRVKELAHLLEKDPTTKDWKIIYLMRDPRGTINSRMNQPWCRKDPKCNNLKLLCDDTLEDVQWLTKLKDKDPEHHYLLKFENFTANIESEVGKLFEFLNQPINVFVKQYMVTHTKSREWEKGMNDGFSVVKDTKEIASKWQTKLSKENITEITNLCKPVLQLLDYPI